MNSSTVYWTNLRTTPNRTILQKLDTLCRTAGLSDLDIHDKFCALKIHFGEPGNMAFVRPPFIRVISAIIKENGGKPFLTDANTLYSGQRATAFDHLRAAFENGFSFDATGCDIIIADGLKGSDYSELPVSAGIHCSSARIACAIAEADAIISINHFKGHELTGFGGALKNLGMGCASRSGKKFLHDVSHPTIHREACTGCGVCMTNCASKAIHIDSEHKAVIEHDVCTGCCQCVAVCQFNAARASEESASRICSERIAEYTQAILEGKPSFHASFILNVSPNCDCWSNNDASIVPDIGIFASLDPVALDQACADAVNASPLITGSAIQDKGLVDADDKFTYIHPDSNWEAGLDHAQSIGLGLRSYTLVEIQ